jgi:hypothetical protein
MSRGVAADCLRQADGPPTQGERRAPARLTFRHEPPGSHWYLVGVVGCALQTARDAG